MLSDKIRPRRRMMADINVVPYIDVMLVLLVVFMVTAPLVTQSIKVDLPSAQGSPMAQEQEPIVLTVDALGQYFVNLGDEKAPKTLEVIGSLVQKIRLESPNTPIFLEGDASTHYGAVAVLLGFLQSIDVQNVGLVTDPQSKPLSPKP